MSKKSVVAAVAAVEQMAITFVAFRTHVYPMSRAAADNARKSGELQTFTDGARRMVLVEKAREFVAKRAARGGVVPPEVSAYRSAAGKKGVAAQRALKRESEAGE